MDESKKIYDVIILGGGCAGLTAGIYSGRAKLRTLILETSQLGGQAAITNDIQNYPGAPDISGPELMQRMLDQAKSFGAEYIASPVKKAELGGDVKTVETDSGVFKSRAVIVATGATPKKLGFEGEEEFRGRGIGYCATCDGFFFQDKDIFVIGGGFSAAEEALYLTRFGKKVTVLVRKDAFRCAPSLVDRVMAHPKIEVKFNTELVRVFGDASLKGAELKNNKTGESFTYKASPEDGFFGVFVFVGYQPTSEMFKGQLELDENGYVLTNDHMETNIKGVYAAGDIRPKSLRQLVTATADGAIAATEAEKYVIIKKEELGIRDEPAEQKAPEPQPAPSASHGSDSGFLTGDLISQVESVFAKLERDVTLVTVTDKDNDKSREMEKFLRQIVDLSSHLRLEVYPKERQGDCPVAFDRLPAVALLKPNGEYAGVKFSGIPGGHEFNSFILAIYNLAGPGQALDEAVKSRIDAISDPVKLQIGISLSCHFCPDVVISSQRIALLNPSVEAEMVDVGLFPEVKKEYNLMSVPALIVNGKVLAFGAQSMEQILRAIEKGA